MCLYVDYDNGHLLEEGRRSARKEHRCRECGRTIEPGEQYQYWVLVGGEFDEGFRVDKMCAHCWATIEVGSAITGCPQSWWWEMVHDLDEETGFVGNILHDDGHNLTSYQKRKMLDTVAGRTAGWRAPDGSLLPVPSYSGKRKVESRKGDSTP